MYEGNPSFTNPTVRPSKGILSLNRTVNAPGECEWLVFNSSRRPHPLTPIFWCFFFRLTETAANVSVTFVKLGRNRRVSGNAIFISRNNKQYSTRFLAAAGARQDARWFAHFRSRAAVGARCHVRSSAHEQAQAIPTTANIG